MIEPSNTEYKSSADSSFDCEPETTRLIRIGHGIKLDTSRHVAHSSGIPCLKVLEQHLRIPAFANFAISLWAW